MEYILIVSGKSKSLHKKAQIWAFEHGFSWNCYDKRRNKDVNYRILGTYDNHDVWYHCVGGELCFCSDTFYKNHKGLMSRCKKIYFGTTMETE